MRKNPVFAFILFTAVFLAAGCQQPSTSGEDPSDDTKSASKAVFYTTYFVGTWIDSTNSKEMVFTSTGRYYDGSLIDNITPTTAIYTQTEFDSNTTISYKRDGNFNNDDYTVNGYLHDDYPSLIYYVFSNSYNTLNYSGKIFTKKNSGGSDTGSVSSDFDITSGSWNYNPASSSGGYLTFTSGGNVTFTPKTSTSSNNYSGTYTLSGTTLTLVMENTAGTTSFTDKFTVTATSSSLGLSLQSSEYTIQGNSGSSTDSSTAITAMWGTGQDSSMTEITLANQ
jgi:hypothetical protein